jgi:hypothetical protein
MFDTCAPATLGGNQGVACAESSRPLDTVQYLADEAERSAHLIAEFIDRFRGHGGNAGNAVTPVPCGHFGQLDRLRNALVTIDQLARELGTIG